MGVALDLITHNISAHHVLSSFVNDCESFMQQISGIRIAHTYGEANACADFLAKMGVALQQNFVLFVEPSHGLSLSLFADCVGATVSRTFVVN